MPRLSKSQISENNFYSGLKDPKGNRKPNEASVKSRPKDSSPYLLVDDDDDEDEDVIGYETPRSIYLLSATASLIVLLFFSSSRFLVSAILCYSWLTIQKRI